MRGKWYLQSVCCYFFLVVFENLHVPMVTSLKLFHFFPLLHPSFLSLRSLAVSCWWKVIVDLMMIINAIFIFSRRNCCYCLIYTPHTTANSLRFALKYSKFSIEFVWNEKQNWIVICSHVLQRNQKFYDSIVLSIIFENADACIVHGNKYKNGLVLDKIDKSNNKIFIFEAEST